MLDALLGHVCAGMLLGSGGLPVPVFYLKQFRSADDPSAACYQALLRGPLILDSLRSFGLLSGEWQLELHALDSLPFLSDLGLGVPQDGRSVVAVEHAFWCDMDFTVGRAGEMTLNHDARGSLGNNQACLAKRPLSKTFLVFVQVFFTF